MSTNDLLGDVNGQNGQSTTNAQISAAETSKIKLTEFHEDNTDLWFWQVEAAFDASGITSDKKKYNTIIGQMPTRVMCRLLDLRKNPPANGEMFATLKKRIIAEFADSTQTKVTKILNEMTLGDQKPSHLLADMRAKSDGTGITEDLLKTIWNGHLPQQTLAILASAQDISVTQSASIADRIWEDHRRTPHVNEVSQSPQSSKLSLESIQTQINQLFEFVKSGNNHQQRSRSTNRSGNGKRSNTPSNFDHGASGGSKQPRFRNVLVAF